MVKRWSLLVVLTAVIRLIGVEAYANGQLHRVGGPNGHWAPDPTLTYNMWAYMEHPMFRINDTLLFKFETGKDSVLWVTEIDYAGCHLFNPVRNYTHGHTVFPLFHSGEFYFISGVPGHCARGQKLMVVVAEDDADRKISPSPASSPAPTPHNALHSAPSHPPNSSHSAPSHPPSAQHSTPTNASSDRASLNLPQKPSPASVPLPREIPQPKSPPPAEGEQHSGEASAPSPSKSAPSSFQTNHVISGSVLVFAMFCLSVMLD